LDCYAEFVADVFLFYVGLVAHDFEEDLESGKFSFFSEEDAGLGLFGCFQFNHGLT